VPKNGYAVLRQVQKYFGSTTVEKAYFLKLSTSALYYINSRSLNKNELELSEKVNFFPKIESLNLKNFEGST